MYRPRHTQAPASRRGVILLVVITLLTLFAVVGLTFVLYAESEATASRIYRERAEVAPVPTDDLPSIFSWGLGQLLYDVSDDNTGAYSAMRGSGFSRTIYGWLDPGTAGNGQNNPDPNLTPFNGTGRLHGTIQPALNTDEYSLVNYTYFQSDNIGLHDPEYLGWRNNLSAAKGQFTGGFNPSYTYPDVNTMALAAVRADGTVLVQSFHRPWTGFGSLDPNNPNWYDTTNPAWKYLVLRPRPVDQLLANETWPPNRPYFPAPADAGGDVKNLVGAPGGNDSIWLDLNAPIKTLPDGTKYKPLFAFLIRDLDWLVNVNTAGNVRYAGNGHASHSGWGRWELNLGAVLNQGNAEWVNLLLNQQQGRYGQDQQPGQQGNNNGPQIAAALYYNRLDSDSAQQGMNGYQASTPMQLPTAAMGLWNGPFSQFPSFGAGPAFGGYDHPAPTDLAQHPAAFNYFWPGANGADDHTFQALNLKQLLANYSNQANGEYSKSVIGQLCPTNAASARNRNLITTLSADLDRPGIIPWVWDPSPGGGAPYALNAGGNPPPQTLYPTGPATPFPPLNQRGNGSPAGSEFNPADWRTISAGMGALLGRIDLQRTLTPYPAPDGTTGVITMSDPNIAQKYQQAVNDRQNFANDIFTILWHVAGCQDPTTTINAGTTTPAFYALQWLAQLAANIVDYIDADNIMTSFNWANVANKPYWVFGTELPPLVLNEVYAELDNDSSETGPKALKDYNANLWVELHNPHNTDPNLFPPDNGQVRLYQGQPTDNNKPAIYELLITQPNTGIRNPGNLLGDPDPGANQVYQTLVSWTPQFIKPSDGQYGVTQGQNQNVGFCVIGPNVKFAAGQDPGLNFDSKPPNNPYCTFLSNSLTYKVPLANVPPDSLPPNGSATVPFPSILLRRLANPGLPPQTDPTKPLYNPYVTIDYVENVQLWDGLQYNSTGADTNQVPMPKRASSGRTQPYAAHSSQWVPQAPTGGPAFGLPQHTFFHHNAKEPYLPPPAPNVVAQANNTLHVPFDWLVHLDRPPVSPIELLNVSAWKPHELTQQFYSPDPTNNNTVTPFQHQARWTLMDTKNNVSSRLWRFFEFVESRDRAAGASVGGRSIGKLNINTILDGEPLLALVDPQASNSFSQQVPPNMVYDGNPGSQANPINTNTVFGKLIQLRTPGMINGGGLSGNDKPIQSLASGFTAQGDPQFPNGNGVTSTILGDGVFSIPNGPAHPYLQNEMLSKVYNNLTTRSNVFAVWCTVGYFQVIDDTTRPMKLGAEIGASQGQNVRHRFFAVVDRTNLTIDTTEPPTVNNQPNPKYQRLQGPQPWFLTGTAPVQLQNNQPTSVQVPVAATQGTYDGTNYKINQGDTLYVDVGPYQEQVQVTATTGNSFTAQFSKPHATGFVITNALLGNPGPQPQFDYRTPRYAPVVRYFAILE